MSKQQIDILAINETKLDSNIPMDLISLEGYLTIRQRGRVVYELIVNEGAARVDYLFRDNEAELSNCFSIHSYPKYKL